MNIPFNGKESYQFICKFYENKPLWYVRDDKNGHYKTYKCYLDKSGHINSPSICLDDPLLRVHCVYYVTWDELFDSKDEADQFVESYLNAYEGFDFKPYLSYEMLKVYKEDLLKAQQKIHEGLKDYPNFSGVDFGDVHAGGIQIRGHHKQIKGYTYGDQPTIQYDFSNLNDAVQDFIGMWKCYDEPQKVQSFQSFIAAGEKYGWD